MSSNKTRLVAFLSLCFVAVSFTSAARADDRASRGELFPVQVGGKLGFIDRAGRLVIKPRFVAARSMYEPHAAFSTWFADERAPVVVDGKWGYVDPSGKLRIKPRFSEARPFTDGVASVCVPDEQRQGYSKCGVINTDGEFVIKPIYDDHPHFSEGLASVSFILADGNYEYGFINLKDELVIASGSGTMFSFGEGLAKVQREAGDEFIDRSGRRVLELNGGRTTSPGFSEGLIPFQRLNDPGGRHVGFSINEAESVPVGYMGKTGKIIIEPRFNIAGDFREGLAAVRVGGLWGFINGKGEFVIKPRFEHVSGFSEGLAAFREGGAWGYINAAGTVLIEPRFAAVLDFRDGLAAVSDDVKPACQTCQVIVSEWRTLGYIDKTGEYVWQPSK